MGSISFKTHRETLEKNMISSDCFEILNLFDITKENAPVLLSLIPVVSFVIYEISQHVLKKYDLCPFPRGDFWEIVKNARHFFKFVKPYDKYNALELVSISEKQFILNHPNPIGKMFQTDLGLYLYKNDPYYDTHMVYFHLSIKNADRVDSGYFFSFGKYLGDAIAKLSIALNLEIPKKNELTIQEYDNFGNKDVKSRKYYKSIFTKQENDQLNCSLNYIFTNVHNLLHVLPLFAYPKGSLMLKIRYLCLYHFSIYLQNLKNHYYRSLSKQSKVKFVDLEYALKPTKPFLNKGLRNVLMHYALSEEIPVLDYSSYDDVYKYYFPNFSVDQLNNQIHSGLRELFEQLKMWK